MYPVTNFWFFGEFHLFINLFKFVNQVLCFFKLNDIIQFTVKCPNWHITNSVNVFAYVLHVTRKSTHWCNCGKYFWIFYS